MEYSKQIIIKESSHLVNLDTAFKADSTLNSVYQSTKYTNNTLKIDCSTLGQTQIDAIELVIATYFDNQVGEQPTISSVEIDTDGRQIIRNATTKKGWRYIAHPFELETSTLDGCYEKDWTESSRGTCTLEFFDDSDTKLIAGTQTELDSDCVKTVLTFFPDFDYDIIGGNVHQYIKPSDDVRLWVIAGAVDLSYLPGTVKEFVGGVNLKFITPENKIETDGRASARLNKTTEGVPVNTNKMQYIIRHPAGYQHQLMIVLEYFRE